MEPRDSVISSSRTPSISSHGLSGFSEGYCGLVLSAMSATAISGDAAAAAAAAAGEVEFVACECCGLTEECTAEYIAVVREQHGGVWICGLCAEAVKDEAYRAGILITPEEAMVRHAAFCRNFRSPGAGAIDPADRLIAAVRQVLRRGLESSSPRATSGPRPKMVGEEVGPRSALSRAGSCYPAVIG